jgi:hypothetical protein
MTATRRQADNRRLLVGQPPIRRRQRPSDLTLRDDRTPGVNPPERGIDQPPLAANEILCRHLIISGAQNLVAIHEPVRPIANLCDTGALDGCRRELLKHGAPVERVEPLRQPMLSSEPRRENLKVTLLAAGAHSARPTGPGSPQCQLDTLAAACEKSGDSSRPSPCSAARAWIPSRQVCVSIPYWFRSRVSTAAASAERLLPSENPPSAAACSISVEKEDPAALLGWDLGSARPQPKMST